MLRFPVSEKNFRPLGHRLVSALAALAVLLLSGFTLAGIIYVDANSTATLPDGSQEAPYPFIQSGIDAGGPQDQVHVAPGTYYETIQMKDGIDLIGAGADVTIIDGTNRGGRVIGFNNVKFNPRLEGFTITGGVGDVVNFIGGVPVKVGGAISIVSG